MVDYFCERNFEVLVRKKERRKEGMKDGRKGGKGGKERNIEERKEGRKKGALVWLSRLRIWCCHCTGSGCCWFGLISGPGASACCGCGQNKEGREGGRKERKENKFKTLSKPLDMLGCYH